MLLTEKQNIRNDLQSTSLDCLVNVPAITLFDTPKLRLHKEFQLDWSLNSQPN